MRLAVLLLLVACGPSATDGGADGATATPDAGCLATVCENQCPAGQMTTISGVVTAPNGVDPVPNAVVYVPSRVNPFPDEVTCEVCTEITGGAVVSTRTGADGRFTLGPVPTRRNQPPGETIGIVVQKGRFRRVVEVPIQSPCAPNEVANAYFELPGRSAGLDSIPSIAVATGDYDAMECVLRKLGIEDSAYERYNGRSGGNLQDLLLNGALMRTYNIIFLNCTREQFESYLDLTNVRDNIAAYVAAGGRLYVTDWSYDYIEQITDFAPVIDFMRSTSGAAPEAKNAAQIGEGALSTEGAILDTELADWLRAVEQATGDPDIISPSSTVHIADFLAQWAMQNAVDTSNADVKVWVQGQVNSDPLSGFDVSGVFPLTTTFDVQDCGRVLYSSYHTEGVSSSSLRPPFPDYCRAGDLTPQERVLEYLILHVADCIIID